MAEKSKWSRTRERVSVTAPAAVARASPLPPPRAAVAPARTHWLTLSLPAAADWPSHSFIKLRMDRVLKAEFTATGAVADVLKSNNTHPKLSAGNRTAEATPPPGPERLKAGYKQEWSAVYEKYDATWWDAFLPPESA